MRRNAIILICFLRGNIRIALLLGSATHEKCERFLNASLGRITTMQCCVL